MEGNPPRVAASAGLKRIQDPIPEATNVAAVVGTPIVPRAATPALKRTDASSSIDYPRPRKP